MSWFIQSKPSFLWETQPERKAVSIIPPLLNVSNQWGFLIHEYILKKIKRGLRWFISYFVVFLILLALQRLKQRKSSWPCYQIFEALNFHIVLLVAHCRRSIEGRKQTKILREKHKEISIYLFILRYLFNSSLLTAIWLFCSSFFFLFFWFSRLAFRLHFGLWFQKKETSWTSNLIKKNNNDNSAASSDIFCDK